MRLRIRLRTRNLNRLHSWKIQCNHNRNRLLHESNRNHDCISRLHDIFSLIFYHCHKHFVGLILRNLLKLPTHIFAYFFFQMCSRLYKIQLYYLYYLPIYFVLRSVKLFVILGFKRRNDSCGPTLVQKL